MPILLPEAHLHAQPFQFCATLCNPTDSSPPDSSVHEITPGKNTGIFLSCPPSGELSNPEIEPTSPALHADSLPLSHQGSPSLLHVQCLTQCLRPAAAAAKSLQSCLTLCSPMDGIPPGSPVPGILQARTLEWVAISFSNAWKWKVNVKSLSRVQLLATPWTAAHQAPLSMGFSRQET